MSLHFSKVGTQEAVSKALGSLFRKLSESQAGILGNLQAEGPQRTSIGRLDETRMRALLTTGKMESGVFRASYFYRTKLSRGNVKRSSWSR